MLNLDELKDKLNTALDKETVDSLNEWLNNKRDMKNETHELKQLRRLAALLQSAWFHGDWKAETANERRMETIMREQGYWPVKMSAFTFEPDLKITQLDNDMEDIVIARVQLIEALNNVQSMIHDLTIGELDELIDEVTVLYERYSDYVEQREGDKPE